MNPSGKDSIHGFIFPKDSSQECISVSLFQSWKSHSESLYNSFEIHSDSNCNNVIQCIVMNCQIKMLVTLCTKSCNVLFQLDDVSVTFAFRNDYAL